jgi:hypothetical protein
MADLYLYTRQIPLWRLSRLWVPLFERAETRWRWPGRFGYLIAMVAEKPGLYYRPEGRAHGLNPVGHRK